jgi:tetratricopeptide (TPR) repeat protein
VIDDFRAGAEAFAARKTRQAIETWKGCLAAEPSNRAFQLVYLLSSSASSARRKHWLQEVLALGSQLLAGSQSAEAYPLLLVAQSAEQPPPQEESIPSTSIEAPEEEEPYKWEIPESEQVDDMESELSSRTIPGGGHHVVPPSPSTPSSDVPSADGGPSDSASTEDTLPPPTQQSTPGRPEIATPEEVGPDDIEIVHDEPGPLSVGGKTSDEDLFSARSEEEREAALFDAREAEAQSAGSQTGPDAERPIPTRSHAGPRRFPMGAVLIGVVAIGLIAALTIAFIFSGEEKVPVEAMEEAAGHLNSGQNTLAITAYSDILSTYGEVASAYLGRGRARIASGDIEQGVADLSRAAELETGTPFIAEELADVLYTRGRFEEAVSYYRQALSAGEVSAEASYRLASSLVALEREDEAPEHLEATLAKNASHGEARLLYGKLLNAAGRFAEAETTLRDAQSPIDSSADYFHELGISLLEQGKLEEAEEVAGLSLGQDPNGARPHTLLGEIYLRRKQYEPARRELIRALRINPQEPRAQIALGRTWLAIAKTKGDERDLIKARQILTNAQGVHEGQRLLTLGEVSMAEGDHDTAVNLIEQSITFDANPLAARLALAEAKYAAKNFEGAAAELQHAAGIAPMDPAVALSLGLVYSELEVGRRASQEFLKAIQGVGMTTPADGANDPVILPRPHIPLPTGFDINPTIRSAYRRALSVTEDDPTALALQALAESASFVISGQN